MIRVAVDAMGSDRGARAVIEGAQQAAADGVQPVIFGSEELDTGGVVRIPTAQGGRGGGKPADALRTKEGSPPDRGGQAAADREGGPGGAPGAPGGEAAG